MDVLRKQMEMIGEQQELALIGIAMRVMKMDIMLVPLGMGLLLAYHVWLLYTIRRHPARTVIGLNADSRRTWAFCLMADPLKNGVLAVQTLRNNIMASTLLATIAITLCSLISVYLSNESTTRLKNNKGGSVMPSIKFFAILICFLIAFLCNLQSIRYYAHTSFLVSIPSHKGRKDAIEYVATNLNRGGFFWSLGLRAFYLSFPLFVWVFGPIPMFICCCVMIFILYFLDTTHTSTKNLYHHSVNAGAEDLEPLVHPI